MQKSLERIIDIWAQRGVYESGVIEKLQAALGTVMFHASVNLAKRIDVLNFSSHSLESLYCGELAFLIEALREIIIKNTCPNHCGFV